MNTGKTHIPCQRQNSLLNSVDCSVAVRTRVLSLTFKNASRSVSLLLPCRFPGGSQIACVPAGRRTRFLCETTFPAKFAAHRIGGLRHRGAIFRSQPPPSARERRLPLSRCPVP